MCHNIHIHINNLQQHQPINPSTLVISKSPLFRASRQHPLTGALSSRQRPLTGALRVCHELLGSA